MTQDTPNRAAISAFVDSPDHFMTQARSWLTSLRHLHADRQMDIILHLSPDVPDHSEKQLSQLGAHIVRVPRALLGVNRYANKLSQLESGALDGYDRVILSDLDTFFLENPLGFSDFTAIAGKIVDVARPPFGVFTRILNRAGLNSPYTPIPTLAGPGALAAPFNFNGGLYLIPGILTGLVRNTWRKWVNFCAAQSDLLGDFSIHCDQIGFAMTILEAQAPYKTLDIYHNFPTHLNAMTQHDARPIYSTITPGPIKMLHYHDRVDPDGRLQHSGTPWIDAHIDRANRILSDHKSSD